MMLKRGACIWLWANAVVVFTCIATAACALPDVHAGSKQQQLPLTRLSGERSLLGGQGAANIARWEAQHADGGLPRKPNSQGPDSTAWSNTIGVCSMIQDENATDVREWVLYYRCEIACVHSPLPL